MIKYPLTYNPILEYWEQIQSGQVTVPYKIIKTYEKLVYDLDHEDEYFYCHKRANHVIEFIENYCKHSKGKMGGKPVILELWEKAMLALLTVTRMNGFYLSFMNSTTAKNGLMNLVGRKQIPDSVQLKTSVLSVIKWNVRKRIRC